MLYMLTFFSGSLPLEAGGKKDGTYLEKAAEETL